MEAFRGLLEHRVIARFDAAVAAGDLGGMAECARIMAEFRQGESQLVQVFTVNILLHTTLQASFSRSDGFFEGFYPHQCLWWCMARAP